MKYITKIIQPIKSILNMSPKLKLTVGGYLAGMTSYSLFTSYNIGTNALYKYRLGDFKASGLGTYPKTEFEAVKTEVCNNSGTILWSSLVFPCSLAVEFAPQMVLWWNKK